MKTVPAQVQIAAPDSLAADFSAAGYTVTILVTRSGKVDLPNDPDALPPLLDAPFSEQEKKNLAGMLAAHEAGRGAT